jgi:hypothetical protein
MLGLGLCLQSQSGKPKKTIINLLGSYGNFGTDADSDGLGDGWANYGITNVSMQDNIQTYTATAQWSAIRYFFNKDINHTYYACAWIKSTNKTTLQLRDDTSIALLGINTVAGLWNFVSGAGSFASNGANTRLVIYDDTATTHYPVQVKKVFLIDLTMSGKTKDEMDAIVQANDYFESVIV